MSAQLPGPAQGARLKRSAAQRSAGQESGTVEWESGPGEREAPVRLSKRPRCARRCQAPQQAQALVLALLLQSKKISKNTWRCPRDSVLLVF